MKMNTDNDKEMHKLLHGLMLQVTKGLESGQLAITGSTHEVSKDGIEYGRWKMVNHDSSITFEFTGTIDRER